MSVLPDGRRARWISESGAPPPTELLPASDTLRAVDALRHLRTGGSWLWCGDYHNGRQLLAALKRRLERSREPLSEDLPTRWRQERDRRSAVADALARVVVVVGADGGLDLRRAPDTREAVGLAWPDQAGQPLLLALPTLIGALGAAGWSREGLEVHGLRGKLYPRFGVFSPTRQAYLHLLDELGPPTGRRVLDVGCGTGVVGLILLQRGAASVHGTDVEPRAITTALDNARRLGLSGRYTASVADLFDGPPADLIVFNPPWVPEPPRTRLDRAVYDEGGSTLLRFLRDGPQHLRPGGELALLISDLPEQLGLRPAGALEQWFAEAGLAVVQSAQRPATHHRARRTQDPLHRARSQEQVSLWVLRPIQGSAG